MSLLKYVNIYLNLIELIEKRSTGSPKELAERMHLSERQIHNYIRDIKHLGHPVRYSTEYTSYILED